MLPRVPGNRVLPIIGTAWTYLPLVGTGDDPDKLHQTYLRKQNQFGDIFAEKLGNKTLVSLFDPKDFETVYRSEGRLPQRLSHDILLHIRRACMPDMYISGGLIPTNGEEWYKIRSTYQDELSGPQHLADYFKDIQPINAEFIAYVEDTRKKTNGLLWNILPLFTNWALENAMKVVLGYRLDGFSSYRKPICAEVIQNAYDFHECVKQAEHSTSWKVAGSKLYQRMGDKEFWFYQFVMPYVDDMIKNITYMNLKMLQKQDPIMTENSVLYKYLKKDRTDVREIIPMVSDLILASFNMVAIAVSVTLHHLGHNPDKQEKAFEELVHLMKQIDGLMSVESFEKVPYLKACVFEALRLNPVVIGNGRILPVDLNLSGYDVKKDTIVLMHHGLAGQMEKYVPRALEFIPERFTQNEPPIHSHTVLPFGTGNRCCVGKELAMIQISTILIMMLLRYKVISKSPQTINSKTVLINFPDTPIDLELKPRFD